jgi:DNA-binding SARP family transcriptional activator/predicted ATPase
MARLHLAVLGTFQARVEPEAGIALPTRKSQALLTYLALPPGRVHGRDKLAALLWGDMADREARGGLRQALSALRKLCSGPTVLVLEGDGVALNPAWVDVDVLEFERRVAEGTPDALARALTLYRGDLLESPALREAPFEEWLLAERERLRQLALDAFAKLLRHQRNAGALDDAVTTAMRLLAFDPLQEPVHRVLMRLYVERGRRAAALRQYQVCISALARELRVEPERATKQLYQEILRQRNAPLTMDVETPEPLVPASPRVHDDVLPRDVPFVGRDGEMLRVRHALDHDWSDGVRIVAVIGEAGVGKSRLVAEVAAEASARHGRVLVGRCHEAEQILPFGPWVDALRAANLNPGDDAVNRLAPLYRAALRRLLPELSRSDQEFEAGPLDHRQIFESVAQVILSLSVQQRLMLILEDVHWADEMSLRLLSYVGRRLDGATIVVVCTARAEDLGDATALRRTLDDLGQRLIRLPLMPLSRTDTLKLARLLAPDAVETEVVTDLFDQIWTTSEGNPLVVVETLRALSEQTGLTPLASVALPLRVREAIGRHLESLGDRARAVATVAAVIGHEFEFPLLQHAAGLDEKDAAEAVEELVRRRILESIGEKFGFTHDRIREVAYQSMLPERQRSLHARITAAISDLYASRLSDHIERLAHHAVRGKLREQAITYLRQAGAKAFSNSAHVEAVANFTTALDLIATVPPSTDRDREELRVRLGLGPTLQVTRGHAASEVEDNFRRARALSLVAGDLVQQFQALWGLWLIASYRADATTALELGAELLALAERSGDPALLLEGHHALWPVLIWMGRGSAARPHLEQGMALYDKAKHRAHAFVYGGHDPGMCALKCASWAFWLLGYPERGLRYSAESLSLAADLAHPPSLVVALVWACIFRDVRREAQAMHDHARALMHVASEQGAQQWLAAGTIFDACVRAELGEGEAAIADIKRGVDVYRSTGAALFMPYFLSLHARAERRIGRYDVALETVAEALRIARATGELVWEPELLRLEGEVRLADGACDVGRVLGCFDRAIEIARREQARSWELRAAVSRARVLAARGERADARRKLSDVYGEFTEGFDTADLSEAQHLLNELA